uniref:Deoxyribonuclease II n=1 Tax=Panagrellus redivivus TaxID=6233 RepID=A0A7E4V720_PANRE
MQLLSILAVLAFVPFVSAALSCKDQNNNDVDWYVGYKMPRTKDNSLQGVGNGVAFYYMDVNTDSFAPSPNDMESKDQAIAYTLEQYYSRLSDPSLFHVMYNDEVAEEALAERMNRVRDRFINASGDAATQFGHNKGVVVFDATGGFWLVHSIPKFPPPKAYGYPDSGTIYAQSILCMTFDYSQLGTIGTQLFFNHPDIYSSSLPTSIAKDFGDLAKVIGGTHKTGTPYTSTETLITRGNQQFTSFAKTGDFNQDLYDVLVAPTLKAPLTVESWRRGSIIPLDCTAKYVVLDAMDMKVGTTAQFGYTHDHSKIAVSASSDAPYVCIGDINRMTSQFVRGGGTVCIKLEKLWNVYTPLFVDTNKCT